MQVLHQREITELRRYTSRVLEAVEADDCPPGIRQGAGTLRMLVFDTMPSRGARKVRESTLSDLRYLIRMLHSQAMRTLGPDHDLSKLLRDFRRFALFKLPEPRYMDRSSRDDESEPRETAAKRDKDRSDDEPEEDLFDDGQNEDDNMLFTPEASMEFDD